MSGPTRSLVFRALCLGIAGGFRSLPPLAALALTYDAASVTRGWQRWPVLRSRWGRRLLIIGGAGEFFTDKLPGTQSRLALTVQLSRLDTGLVGRVAVVTLAGAALGSEYGGKNSVVIGAACGAVGALLGNYGGYHARKAAVEATGWPDPTVAVIEDEAAITLISVAVHNR